MGIFPQLFDKRSRSISSGGLDVFNDFWYNVAGGPTNSGVQVSEKTALKYLTVFSCVSLIAGDIARLPLMLYRKKSDDSRERVSDHPLYDLLHNAPNPEVNSFNWRETAQNHLLLWGNTYNEIKRDPYNGEITALWQLENPGAVSVKRDSKSGQLYYKWVGRDGKTVQKSRREIFHIPGFGFNGLTGMSMIGLAREAIGLGLAAGEFHSRFFADGTHPSVVVTIPPEVNLGDNEKEYKERLQTSISGLKNAHGIAVFSNGETISQLTMPLKDAQFIESSQANDMKICGFYHVPPHKAALFSKNANRNNMEQENQSYVDSCLIHWTTRWEQAISHQLLTPEERREGLFWELNLSGLLRGDTAARGEFYKTLFNMGYPLNRILAKENENPVEGGDEGYIQLNMIPISKVGDIADSQIAGGNGGPQEGASVRRIEEKRSLLVRDRLARQYYPLFLRAAEKIVSRENIAVKREIGKQEKERAKSDMETWLNNFYRSLPEYIRQEIGPVFKSFSRAVADASAEEMGVDLDEDEINRFINDYIKRYAERHAGGSLGQLTALLRDEGKELSDLEVRVDEWSETRPEKIATNESVRGSSAIFQVVAFGAGLGTYWRIRGAKTCPYCRELDGRRVRSGESFIDDGDELNPKGGTGPMKIRGMKAHPPLHQGCDCYLSAG